MALRLKGPKCTISFLINPLIGFTFFILSLPRRNVHVILV